MSNFVRASSHPRHRSMTKIFWLSMLSSVGLLSGVVPGISKDFSQLSFDFSAQAQSAEQISSYAKAVLEGEPVRLKYLNQARKVMGGSVPENVCRQSNVPGPIKGICARFFSESADVINRNISSQEFNQITQRAQSDANLRRRIQQEMIRQQR